MGATLGQVACLPRSGPAPLRGTQAERIEGLAQLLEVEDRRDVDASVMGRLSASPDPWLRARVAWTCGRLRDPEASPFLVVLLNDPDATVRAAAAFGIGLSTDRRLVRFLVAALADVDPGVAAFAAESLGKLGGDEAIVALRGRVERSSPASEGSGPEVAAALALFRFPSADVASALARIALAPTTSRALRRASVYALSRRPVPEAAPALRRALSDPEPELVAWAARGLGVLADAESVPRLVDLARAANASVAIQALGALERIARQNATTVTTVKPGAAGAGADSTAVALERAAGGHPGVAVSAIRLLGRVPPTPDVVATLQRLIRLQGWRGQVAVSAAVLASRDGASALPEGGLALLAAPTSPIALRLGAAEALSSVEPTPRPPGGAGGGAPPPNVAAEVLHSTLPVLLQDPSARVRRSALSAAGRDRLGVDLLVAALGDADASVVATALDLAAPLVGKEPALTSAWERAYERLLKEPEADFQVSALDAVAQLGAAARERILARVDDPEHVVREKARRLLVEKHGEKAGSFRSIPVTSSLRRDDYRRLARLAIERELTARIRTSRGELLVELACEEAPMTADSFRTLADRRFFDGILIHRVVPDFVVQAGDPRGDGTGGPGYSIRDEINPRRYERGALGMALSGPDTGGSQWFVTLAAQPHLDGGYTVFGRVVSGMDVADLIEQDDRLLSVRVEETARRRPPVPHPAGSSEGR